MDVCRRLIRHLNSGEFQRHYVYTNEQGCTSDNRRYCVSAVESASQQHSGGKTGACRLVRLGQMTSHDMSCSRSLAPSCNATVTKVRFVPTHETQKSDRWKQT